MDVRRALAAFLAIALGTLGAPPGSALSGSSVETGIHEVTAPSSAEPIYHTNYFAAYPAARGQVVVVHHAIEQQILGRWPDLFTEAEIHDPDNLRGIPDYLTNRYAHLSLIRRMWDRFYDRYPKGWQPDDEEGKAKLRAEVEAHRDLVDAVVGSVFWENDPENVPGPVKPKLAARRSAAAKASQAALFFSGVHIGKRGAAQGPSMAEVRKDAQAELWQTADELREAAKALRESADSTHLELADELDEVVAELEEAATDITTASWLLRLPGLEALVQAARQLRHAATGVGSAVKGNPAKNLAPAARALGRAGQGMVHAARAFKETDALESQLRNELAHAGDVLESTAKRMDSEPDQPGGKANPEVAEALRGAGRQLEEAAHEEGDHCQVASPGRGASRSFSRVAPQRLSASHCRESPRVPALVKQLADAAVQSPGGIDFSSVGLRYVSEHTGRGGLGYAFSVKAGKDPRTWDVTEGLRNAKLASDALFIWLALPRTTFWVNLKPNEPDNLVDAKLGRTLVGKVMLEADFALKKYDARLLDPTKRLGARVFRETGSCIPIRRLWISSAPATVREDGDALYIIDAPLKVSVEYFDYRPGPGDPPVRAGKRCTRLPDRIKRRNVATYRRVVLPHLTRTVNRSPEFADLRRIYLSRVAAEWYRERSETEDTVFDGIIDSGRVDRWQLRGNWRPKRTFEKFVRSWVKGDYRRTITTRKGNTVITRTYVFGGVDFSVVPRRRVDDTAFEREHGSFARTVRRAVEHGMSAGRAGSWVGATTPVDRAAVAREFPVPEPQSSDEGADRSPAEYAVWLLVLLGAAMVGLAVVRRLTKRHQGGMR